MFAAKNFILAGSAVQLKTTTFPASTTSSWTTPADVTNLVVLSGKGQDSYASTWTYDVNASSTSFATDTGWTDYASLYSFFQGRLTTINTGAPASRYITNIGTYFIEFRTTTNTLWAFQNTTALTVYGTATLTWNLPTSGAITTSINGTGSGVNSYISIPWYATGSASTAFGQTFPGGSSGSPASLTTFNNVAVTPSTSYSIVNNANSTVITVQYYSAF
jgi:hypothetical protein